MNCQLAPCYHVENKNNVTLTIQTSNKITRSNTDAQSPEEGKGTNYRHAACRYDTRNTIREIYDVRMAHCNNYLESAIGVRTVSKQNMSSDDITSLLCIYSEYTRIIKPRALRARYQASTAVQYRPPFFWGVMWRRLVVCHLNDISGQFIYQFHLQSKFYYTAWSLEMGPTCPETSFR